MKKSKLTPANVALFPEPEPPIMNQIELNIDAIQARLAAHQPHQVNIAAKRQAAVALILREGNTEPEVLLIQRAEHEDDPWSGDLGFPGGRIEKSDASPKAAAERETWEEIGLTLAEKDFLGQSDDMAALTLSVRICCFVYHLAKEVPFQLNEEVVNYFWVPFSTLLSPERNELMYFHHRGTDRQHPVVHLQEWSSKPLWGITYRLLDSFFNLLDLSFHYPEKIA